VPEDQKDRVDRELIELLNELRIVLPGVQVLFAFLLTMPFTQRFDTVTEAQRGVYFGALLCTALATALFIAPSTYHRLRFREKDKESMLFTANKLAIAGTILLALATSAVVYLITDVLYHVTVASLVTAAVTGWFVWFWYGLPLSRKVGDGNDVSP
jgi:Family of unknown function (DUF6328)